MKTKRTTGKKVNVITLGCAKNLVDSEVLVTQLKSNGYDAVHEQNKSGARVAVINTCGFIGDAREESIDTILRVVDEKKSGRYEKIYVTGCLSQRYRDELRREIPEVDAWFGTRELPELLHKFRANYRDELVGERIPSTGKHYAYMKISEGCDRPCSFCAIPLMRGKHVSRPLDELIREAQNLAARGVRELLVIAQDTTYYGIDLYGKRRLDELLRRLSDVKGLEWIRLHYAFPAGFPMEVLDVMAERKNICNYLDIPLQHASDHMLKTMRRGIDKKRTEELLTAIREKIPDVAIRTTMLTGHPGETKKDFEELMAFVEKWKFERLGVFAYSHEEGTHAFTLKDDVPAATKNARASRLMDLQQEISLELNSQKIGNIYRVLIDRMESGRYIGRTEYDSPEVDNEVIIEAQTELKPGTFTDVLITSASEFDLHGVPAGSTRQKSVL